jgi:hypothetical protein
MAILTPKGYLDTTVLGLYSPTFIVLGIKNLKDTWLTCTMIGILGKCIGDVGQFIPIVPILQGTYI